MVHDCPSIQLFVFNSCKDSKWEINCFKLRRGYERWQEKAKNLRCLLQQVKKKNVSHWNSGDEQIWGFNRKNVNKGSITLNLVYLYYS